jgi:hypothetical protein
VSAVRLVQITFQKELYSGIVAACLSANTSTVLYGVPLQTGVILVRGEAQILGAFKTLRKQLLASSCLSVHQSARNSRASTGRIFIKFDILAIFFVNLSRKFKFH